MLHATHAGLCASCILVSMCYWGRGGTMKSQCMPACVLELDDVVHVRHVGHGRSQVS